MFTYVRKVAYHETDKMSITHHSNYVKWMEEARIDYLEHIGLPFSVIEEKGIASPVTGISVEYKTPSSFGDEIIIEISVIKYSGVQLELSYLMKNKGTGDTVATAFSKHCFLKNGKIISLKKENPEIHSVFQNLIKETENV